MIDFQIRTAWAKISRTYNAIAVQSGGTLSIGYILLNIDRKGSPSTSLGPKMGLEPTSLARSLKKMEEADLIYRIRDNADKRCVKIFLTEEGKKMRKVSKAVVIRFNEEVRQKISAKKLEIFQQVIEDLNEVLDENKIFN